MLYECPYCGNIADSEQWNKSTIEYYKTKFNKANSQIGKIEYASSGHWFICPFCSKKSFKADINTLSSDAVSGILLSQEKPSLFARL